MVRKYNFNEMQTLHKRLEELCIERFGDDILTAYKKATWMMRQEGLGFASKGDIEKIAKRSKVPKAEDLFKKALDKRGINTFVT